MWAFYRRVSFVFCASHLKARQWSVNLQCCWRYYNASLVEALHFTVPGGAKKGGGWKERRETEEKKERRNSHLTELKRLLLKKNHCNHLKNNLEGSFGFLVSLSCWWRMYIFIKITIVFLCSKHLFQWNINSDKLFTKEIGTRREEQQEKTAVTHI